MPSASASRFAQAPSDATPEIPTDRVTSFVSGGKVTSITPGSVSCASRIGTEKTALIYTSRSRAQPVTRREAVTSPPIWSIYTREGLHQPPWQCVASIRIIRVPGPMKRYRWKPVWVHAVSSAVIPRSGNETR